MGADERSDGRHVELYSERSTRLVRSLLPLYFQNEKHLKTPKKNERRYGCTIGIDVTLILSRTLFATFASSIIEHAIIESLIFGVLLHV